MTQSVSLTRSTTFTIADAKYLASRISADLTQMRLFYGEGGYFTNQKIADLAVEAAMLLKYGLLDSVKYGFQKDGEWVIAIRYAVNSLNQLELADNSPGSIYSQADVTGASGHSYLLTKTNPEISDEDRVSINAENPVKRTSGQEPSSAGGQWDNDKTYYRNGTGIQRGQFRR